MNAMICERSLRTFPSVSEFLRFVSSNGLCAKQELPLFESAYSSPKIRCVPSYLFRGENQWYPSTLSGLNRLLTRDKVLADLAQQLGDNLVHHLSRVVECECHDAYGLLQHYGVPTPVIDFSSNVRVAVAFACGEARRSGAGYIAVLPVKIKADELSMAYADYESIQFADRPQRQRAFGSMPTSAAMCDLKSAHAISSARIGWYKVIFTREDVHEYRDLCVELMRADNDPIAGFLRFELTRLIQSLPAKKLSWDLVRRLIQTVPMFPCLAFIRIDDQNEVFVEHVSAKWPECARWDKDFEGWVTARIWSGELPVSEEAEISSVRNQPPDQLTLLPFTYHGDRDELWAEWERAGSPRLSDL